MASDAREVTREEYDAFMASLSWEQYAQFMNDRKKEREQGREDRIRNSFVGDQKRMRDKILQNDRRRGFNDGF